MQVLDRVLLKDGSTLSVALISGPDPGWAEHIIPFLAHKPEHYLWQIRVSLKDGFPGLDAWYYVGLIDGELVANITVIARRGVGVLGHVFTLPAHRGKGVASALMAAQMAHFRASGGRALYLGTGYDSSAYHIYYRNGFRSLEPKSGAMQWIASDDVYEQIFAPKPHQIRPLAWPDWGSLSVVCGMPQGDFLRSNILPAYRPAVVEGNFLTLMHRIERGEAKGWVAAAVDDTVLGFALTSRPRWWRAGSSTLVDLYAHPDHLDVLADLDAAVEVGGRRLVLADGDAGPRIEALQGIGYTVAGRLDGELSHEGVSRDLVMLQK